MNPCAIKSQQPCSYCDFWDSPLPADSFGVIGCCIIILCTVVPVQAIINSGLVTGLWNELINHSLCYITVPLHVGLTVRPRQAQNGLHGFFYHCFFQVGTVHCVVINTMHCHFHSSEMLNYSNMSLTVHVFATKGTYICAYL